MSKFHDDLIEARRRGEAPGMAAEEPPEPLAVTFIPVPEGVPLGACSRCGAAVPVDRAPYHVAWHVQMGD